MAFKPFAQIIGQSGEISSFVGFALEDVNVVHQGLAGAIVCGVRVCKLALVRFRELRSTIRTGLPSRSSRDRMATSRGPPSPRLRRDSLRSHLRRERRLEARGFEPLTSSLQSWRSTN